MKRPDDLKARLAAGQLLLLDGATGTELTRRGVDTTLPLWSARALLTAPDVVLAIHRDYVQAGAQIITANTFRTHRRSLAKGGLGDHTAELTGRAVQLARDANSPFVAGSVAPLEDCYSPHLVPPDADLEAEHAAMAGNLAAAGVDLLLVETMNTIREARAATSAARATGLPIFVSFVCAGATGEPVPSDAPGRLLGGESLVEAVRAIGSMGPEAILVNCVPVAMVEQLLLELQTATRLPLGAYANVGHVDERVGWTLTDAVSPAEYVIAAREWRAAGAAIIGGCCGTGPGHIAALTTIR